MAVLDNGREKKLSGLTPLKGTVHNGLNMPPVSWVNCFKLYPRTIITASNLSQSTVAVPSSRKGPQKLPSV